MSFLHTFSVNDSQPYRKVETTEDSKSRRRRLVGRLVSVSTLLRSRNLVHAFVTRWFTGARGLHLLIALLQDICVVVLPRNLSLGALTAARPQPSPNNYNYNSFSIIACYLLLSRRLSPAMVKEGQEVPGSTFRCPHL